MTSSVDVHVCCVCLLRFGVHRCAQTFLCSIYVEVKVSPMLMMKDMIEMMVMILVIMMTITMKMMVCDQKAKDVFFILFLLYNLFGVIGFIQKVTGFRFHI